MKKKPDILLIFGGMGKADNEAPDLILGDGH